MIENRTLPGWKVTKKLGTSAYSTVYEIAREDNPEFTSALKIITIPQDDNDIKELESQGLDKESIAKYYAKAVEEVKKKFEVMEKFLGESNTVTYHDHTAIQHRDGLGWDILVRMELLTPFAQYTNTNKLSEHDVIKLGIEIAGAIAFCEKQNIIHRDIKPTNIFVNKYGSYKLGDFEITSTIEKNITSMVAKRNAEFMAPEVYANKKYDKTIDIYSLCMSLYVFLNNGRPPFVDKKTKTITQDIRNKCIEKRMAGNPVPPPINGSKAFKDVILKGLAFSPEQRWQTAEEFGQALAACEVSSYMNNQAQAEAQPSEAEASAETKQAQNKPSERTGNAAEVTSLTPDTAKPAKKAASKGKKFSSTGNGRKDASEGASAAAAGSASASAAAAAKAAAARAEMAREQAAAKQAQNASDSPRKSAGGKSMSDANQDSARRKAMGGKGLDDIRRQAAGRELENIGRKAGKGAAIANPSPRPMPNQPVSPASPSAGQAPKPSPFASQQGEAGAAAPSAPRPAENIPYSSGYEEAEKQRKKKIALTVAISAIALCVVIGGIAAAANAISKSAGSSQPTSNPEATKATAAVVESTTESVDYYEVASQTPAYNGYLEMVNEDGDRAVYYDTDKIAMDVSFSAAEDRKDISLYYIVKRDGTQVYECDSFTTNQQNVAIEYGTAQNAEAVDGHLKGGNYTIEVYGNLKVIMTGNFKVVNTAEYATYNADKESDLIGLLNDYRKDHGKDKLGRPDDKAFIAKQFAYEVFATDDANKSKVKFDKHPDIYTAGKCFYVFADYSPSAKEVYSYHTKQNKDAFLAALMDSDNVSISFYKSKQKANNRYIIVIAFL